MVMFFPQGRVMEITAALPEKLTTCLYGCMNNPRCPTQPMKSIGIPCNSTPADEGREHAMAILNQTETSITFNLDQVSAADPPVVQARRLSLHSIEAKVI